VGLTLAWWRSGAAVVVGDARRVRADFLTMIGDVFGELRRIEAGKKLSARR